MFEAAWEKNLLEKPGDETDLKAAELLAALADGIAAEVPADTEEETDRAKIIFLNPKITRDRKSDALQLSFMIGKSGERFYTLRSLDKLVAAESRKGVYELSKKSSIDFSAQDFTDDSRKWFDFIATRVRNLDSLNRRLEHVFFYVPQLSAGSGIPLEGNDLDRIYDLLKRDITHFENILFSTITGSTPKQERLRLVNDFNNGDTPVFLISLRAGGTGLNLVGADVVIHYDPWWNLAVQNQATDRAQRIGQTRQVTVVKMIAMDTIEEKIILLQEAKREMADAIMNGEGTSLASLSKEELLELVQ